MAFKQKVSNTFAHIKTSLIGISIGVIITMLAMTFHPFDKVVVHVPKIVEKPVIVKVPIKLTENDKKQIKCMAMNAYYEGRNQGTTGIVAINNVVLNRTQHPAQFGKTPCDVVNQKTGNVWQFSWHGENVGTPKDFDTYAQVYYTTMNVYLGNISDITGGATYYHAKYVNPSWHNMKKTVVYGEHIFYKKNIGRNA